MIKKIFSLKFLLQLFSIAFIYVCCFPFIRTALFGAKEMSGMLVSLFTIMPDLLFFAILIIGIYHFITNKSERPTWHLFDYFIIAFFLLNVVYGFAISDFDKQSLMSFRITYYPITFYFIGRLYQNKIKELFTQPVKVLFYGLCAFAVAGVVLYVFFLSYQNKLILETGNLVTAYFIIRMTSLVLTPVLFAVLMAFSAVYFYNQVIKNASFKNYLMFFIVWFCLLMSVSRGATIAFLISFIFLTCVYKQWKTSLFVVLGMGSILISVSLYATGSLELIKWMCYSTAHTMNFDNDVTRVNRWLVSYEDFLRQPGGYGFGKTGAVAFRYYLNDPQVKAAVYSTDGWYLKIACETGVLGILSYLILSASYFFILLKKAIRTKASELLVPFGIFIFINIQCVVSNTLDFYPYILLYWLLIGLSINYLKETNAS